MKKNSPIYVIVFMVIISALFGAGISLVHYLTLEKLETNARLFRNRTIAQAFSLNVKTPTAEAYEKVISENLTSLEFAEQKRLWEVFIRKDEPSEIGFVFSGMGFWDVIRGVLVVSPDLKTIESIEFLDQKETPGLGARIEEQWFKKQFSNYPIDWDNPQGNQIEFGQDKDKARIDAITGATQTSMAVEKILNIELKAFRSVYEQKIKGQHTR